MTLTETRHATMAGAGWATAAATMFSVNDMLVKFLSGDYALHEVVLIRSIVGMAVVLGFLMPLSGGVAALRTRRLGIHLLRGLCVVLANLCFFTSLAALPLAEAVAIFFVSPLLIAAGSVIFLGERVGPRRWSAIALGLVGVLIVIRPGTEAFQPAALLPILAAACYAALHIFTRKIGPTETALSLVFYVQLSFIGVSGLIGLTVGHGGFAGGGDPSLEFLLRGWVVPGAADFALMALIGVITAFAGYAIGQAYRLSEAALVAPFEYAAMPLSVFWGWLVFSELPDAVAFAGIALILAAGLILVWREAAVRRRVSRPPAPR